MSEAGQPESAIVALIPEAESLVEPFRRRYDPSAVVGVPAHVTILYPFKPPDELGDSVLSALRQLFLSAPSFEVAFPHTARFPDVLYLTPQPAEPFRRLTAMVVERFPETPPYRGAFLDVIPHLTLAQVADVHRLDAIAADFHAAAERRLPVRAVVRSVALMDNASGYWQVHTLFALASESHSRGQGQ